MLLGFFLCLYLGVNYQREPRAPLTSSHKTRSQMQLSISLTTRHLLSFFERNRKMRQGRSMLHLAKKEMQISGADKNRLASFFPISILARHYQVEKLCRNEGRKSPLRSLLPDSASISSDFMSFRFNGSGDHLTAFGQVDLRGYAFAKSRARANTLLSSFAVESYPSDWRISGGVFVSGSRSAGTPAKSGNVLQKTNVDIIVV